MRKEMIFYGFYLLFPFCFEWMLADLEPCEAQWEGAGWIPPEPAKPDTSIIFKNPARSCHPEILYKIFSRHSGCILFYRNGWRINLWWMCVYRMCYQANVLISWSFWLHELYGSDVPFPMISLSHILTNAFPSKKMKCLLPRFLCPNLHFNLFPWPPLLQACDLIFWTIDGNLALFQWLPPPLSGWRLMWPWPGWEHRPDPATTT